jgi:hypothetical protein
MPCDQPAWCEVVTPLIAGALALSLPYGYQDCAYESPVLLFGMYILSFGYGVKSHQKAETSATLDIFVLEAYVPIVPQVFSFELTYTSK